MKTVKTQKSILILSLILALIVMVVSMPIIATASAKTEIETSKQLISNMSAYETKEKNVRLYNMTKSHISSNMEADLKIANIKPLKDFADNEYTLFELKPTGYIIYDNASGKYIEYSSSSESPYKDREGHLYYAGAMEYYCKNDELLSHTIMNDNYIDSEDEETLSSYCNEIHKFFQESLAMSNLAYIEGQADVCYVDARRETSTTLQAANKKGPRISTVDFFPRLTNSMQMGYRDGGVCGYVATNLIIGYCYFAYDYGLINNSTYIDRTNLAMNGSGLTNRLIECNGLDSSQSYFDGTTAKTSYDYVSKYMEQVHHYEGWTISWRLLAINLQKTLNEGYPVAIFGNLKYPYNDKTDNHTVVAYQYENYGFLNCGVRYRVHYGWPGYADVWLEMPTIGEVFFMKLS